MKMPFHLVKTPQKHEISTAGCVGPILYHDPLGVVQHLHGWFGGLVGGGGEEVKGAAGGENGRFLREIHGVFLGSMDCFLWITYRKSLFLP